MRNKIRTNAVAYHINNHGGELDVKLYANEDRVGFATAVCKQCGKKEYVSRMRFNENAKTLPF